MVEDKLTAQIGNKYGDFSLFDTGQANFGRYGWSISGWEDREHNIYALPVSVSYRDISSYGDEQGNVHLSARWMKNKYRISALKFPEECSSGLSGFDDYEYESLAEVSAGNEDKNYRFSSWSFPDGSTSADNPMTFQVLSALELSANFKDLRTLLMWTKSGRIAMFRYSDISGDPGDPDDRENVLRYRARGGEGVIYPFIRDQDLSAPSSLAILSVAEENINAVDQSAFIECENLWTVGCQFISSVEASAFANCGALEHLYAPDLVLAGNCAFAGCSSLDSVSLPSVLSVRENAFTRCGNVASVYAPRLTDIASGAFSGCVKLTAVDFPSLSSIGSLVFDCGLSTQPLAAIECPNLRRAGPSAFYNCGKLVSLDGVSGIARVKDSMFAGCRKLKTLTFLSANAIEQNALSGCEDLVALYAYSVSAIGASAFCGCSSLKKIDFGYNLSLDVPELISTAFDGLSGITCYIPKNGDLYANWLSADGWKDVISNNNMYIYQHTLSETETQ